MRSLKTLPTQLAIVLALAMQANARGQDLVGLNVGQSYFETYQPALLGKSECEPKVVSEIHAEPAFGLKLGRNSDAFSLEIHDEIELLMSRSSLEKFALHTNAFELPSSFGSAHSDLLIARWDGKFLGFGVATTAPKPQVPRPFLDRFELIWTATGFQLKSYKCPPVTGCRIIFDLPAQLVDTVPLTANFRGLNLVLTPKATEDQLPFNVTISKTGKAYLAAGSIDPVSAQILRGEFVASPTKANSLVFFEAVDRSFCLGR